MNTRAISRIMGALSAFTGGRRSVTVATRSVTETWSELEGSTAPPFPVTLARLGLPGAGARISRTGS